MEHLNNVFIDVDDYSMLRDRKLFTRPHVRIKRLSQKVQRRYLPYIDREIGSTNDIDKQTAKRTKSKKFKFFYETKAVTEDNCSVLEENQPADSLPRCRSPADSLPQCRSSDDAYCHQLLNFISDQLYGKDHLSIQSDPLLTSDSHTAQIAGESDCVENISYEAQPADFLVFNKDTGDDPSLNVHALVEESEKTDILPISFAKCVESKEASCQPSTKIKIINFSTKDRNSDDDDGVCRPVGYSEIQTGKTKSMLKCEKSFGKFYKIKAAKQTDESCFAVKQTDDDNCCVLKKEDQQADSFESGKSVVPPSSFNECAESNEASCPPTSGLEIANLFAGDSRVDSHNDAVSDDGDCSAVDDGDFAAVDDGNFAAVDDGDLAAVDDGDLAPVDDGVFGAIDEGDSDAVDDEKSPSGIIQVNSGIVQVKSEEDEDVIGDCEDVDDRDCGAIDDGDSGAVDDEKSLSGIIQVNSGMIQEVNSEIVQMVKSEDNEDIIGRVESIGNAVYNDDIKVEEGHNDTSCIEKESDIHDVIPKTVRQTRSRTRVRRQSNTSSVLHDNTTRIPLLPSNEHEDDDDDDDPADDDDDDDYDDYHSADDSSDSGWEPLKKRNKKSKKVTSTSKSQQLVSSSRGNNRSQVPSAQITSTNHSPQLVSVSMGHNRLSSVQITSTNQSSQLVNVSMVNNSSKVPLVQTTSTIKSPQLVSVSMVNNSSKVPSAQTTSTIESPQLVCVSMGNDSSKVPSAQIPSTKKSPQLTSILRSANQRKQLGSLHSTKNSSEEVQTNSYCEKDGLLALTKKSGICAANANRNSILIECIHCESTIISLKDVREHVTVHIDPAIMNIDPNHESVETPTLVCGDCKEAFSNRDDFLLHCQQHGPKFACFVCNKLFAFLDELRVHVEWHLDDILYTCRLCSAKFSTRSMYEKHVSKHKRGLMFTCNVCDYKFSIFNEMKIHMQTHYSNKNQNFCPICGKGFNLEDRLRVHLGISHSTEKLYSYLIKQSLSLNSNFSHAEESVDIKTEFPQIARQCMLRKSISHHEKPNSGVQKVEKKNKNKRRKTESQHEKPNSGVKKSVKKKTIKCLHCATTFTSLVYLLDHVKVHIDPANLKVYSEFVCGDCGVTFSKVNKREFAHHCRSHDPVKPFRCQICDCRFGSPLYKILKHNARMHSEPKLPCFVCDKRFTLLERLNRHVRWHFDGILYKCGQCSAEFSSSALYDIHRSKHLGITKFECSECAKEFPDRYHLKIHFTTHNRGKKSVLCPVCGKRFYDQEGMRSHFENKHCTEKPFTCTLCPKTFSEMYWMNKHIKNAHLASRYKCNLCDKSFTSKSNLEVHLQRHTGEKPYACKICNKMFSTKIDVSKHSARHRVKSSERTFKCKLCDKSYLCYNNLLDHKKVKHDAQRFVCNLCGKVLTRSQTLRQHMKTHDK